jgi:hypothetical protein
MVGAEQKLQLFVPGVGSTKSADFGLLVTVTFARSWL